MCYVVENAFVVLWRHDLTTTESRVKVWCQYNVMYLSSMVALAAVHSKVVVLLLLIYCLMYFPLRGFCVCLNVSWYALLCVVSIVLQSS